MADIAASMDALAAGADVVAAFVPKVSSSTAATAAASWGSPLTGWVDILNGDCNE